MARASPRTGNFIRNFETRRSSLSSDASASSSEESEDEDGGVATCKHGNHVHT